MHRPDTLTIARQQLSDAISNFHTPTCDPLAVSQWIAMSLLIKSVRRGHEHLAMRAAATLLRDAPDKLWRRIGGLAFEEVGLADIGSPNLPPSRSVASGCKIARNFDPTSKVSQRIDLVAKDWNWEVIFRVQP